MGDAITMSAELVNEFAKAFLPHIRPYIDTHRVEFEEWLRVKHKPAELDGTAGEERK